MNWIDLLILIVILVPAYVGFRNGLLRKLFGLAGIIAGFILAVKFYRPVSELISPVINSSIAIASIISFLAILILTYGLSVYLAKYMSNLHPTTNVINKLTGTAAGILQGLILSSIILFNLNHIGVPSEETRKSSLLYNKVVKVAPFIFDKLVYLLPGNQSVFDEFNRNDEKKDTNNRRR